MRHDQARPGRCDPLIDIADVSGRRWIDTELTGPRRWWRRRMRPKPLEAMSRSRWREVAAYMPPTIGAFFGDQRARDWRESRRSLRPFREIGRARVGVRGEGTWARAR